MNQKKQFIKNSFLALVVFLISINPGVAQQAQNAGKKPTLSGYAPVNGLRVYYEIYGEGEPVILLHGAYMTIGLNWAQIIPELSENRQVIALEMQGHGRTADTERPFSYAKLADDVAGVMEHLDIGKADIMGYSFGGTIALQLAIQNSERVNKLIIISTAFKFDGWMPEAKQVFASMEPDFLDNTPLQTEYKNIAPNPEHWHPFVEKFITFDKENYNLGEENIRSIKSPTLLIMGDNDGVSMEHKAEMYKLLGGCVFGDMAGIPESHLAILPGTGHVSLMMKTKEVLDLVKQF